MNLRLLLFSWMVFALANLSFAQNKSTYWILDVQVPMRSKPNLQASEIGALRTGTRFESTKKSGDWVYVDKVHYNQTIGGWVQSSMVSETEVDSIYILKQFSQAKTFADSVKWCERLVSLLPNNKVYIKALMKGYIALGNKAKAAYYKRELRGTNPIYMARYDGKDLLVIGAIDSTGAFQGLLWHESVDFENKKSVVNEYSKAIKKKAMNLRMSLAAMDWYGPGYGDYPIFKVDRIMLPKIVPQPNKMEEYSTDIEGTATFGISLGSSSELYKFTQEGDIIATKPIYSVPVSGLRRRSTVDSVNWYKNQLVNSTFDYRGFTDIKYGALHEYGYVDICIGGILENRYGRGGMRGIFNKQGKLLYTGTGNDFGNTLFTSRWFRFGPNASYPAFIILPFSTVSPPSFEEGNGSYGYNLLRLNKTKLKTFTVRSDEGGC